MCLVLGIVLAVEVQAAGNVANLERRYWYAARAAQLDVEEAPTIVVVVFLMVVVAAHHVDLEQALGDVGLQRAGVALVAGAVARTFERSFKFEANGADAKRCLMKLDLLVFEAELADVAHTLYLAKVADPSLELEFGRRTDLQLVAERDGTVERDADIRLVALLVELEVPSLQLKLERTNLLLR